VRQRKYGDGYFQRQSDVSTDRFPPPDRKSVRLSAPSLQASACPTTLHLFLPRPVEPLVVTSLRQLAEMPHVIA
jgi:hypothetical protein